MGAVQVERAMAKVTAGLPGGGEERPGQRRMAQAVAVAIATRRHLVVSAGTGTGKSLAYLVPAILSGKRVVVATATKALQDQLATRDLPLLTAGLDRSFRFAVLKGRSNYLCRQRARELAGGAEAPGPTAEAVPLDLGAARPAAEATNPARPAAEATNPARPAAEARLWPEVRALLDWAQRSPTGDRAELEVEPSPRAWGLLSVGPRECPGPSRCPSGQDCFAEAARARAVAADVVVVNTHLYCAHLASEGAVLPDHEVVVFDEAHELEDVATASLGTEVSGGRLRALARLARPALGRDGAAPADALEAAGDRLDAALGPLLGQRLPADLGPGVGPALALAEERLARLSEALRQARPAQGALDVGDAGALADPARARALLLAGQVATEVRAASVPGEDQVAWVEGPASVASLRVAPIEVGPVLAERLWSQEVTAVLTSATIPTGLGHRLGLPAGRIDDLDVGSPFPYATHGLLYCAAHLPDRRRPGAQAAAHEELASLIQAAGGRTLALFTSWRAMGEGARLVRERVPFRILTQDELPKPALVAAFTAEESACLFATMGFWQGLDVPGPTLSLVVIDRLPFPRPDDPLMEARRERAGASAFRTVDLPRAAMLLAQGAGRLIRSGSDRGVVAVLDRRLAAASYRWDLVRALPPLARTRHRHDVDAFLAALRAQAPEAALRSPH